MEVKNEGIDFNSLFNSKEEKNCVLSVIILTDFIADYITLVKRSYCK